MDIVIFIVALSVLVLVHELGHFMAAKLTGVRVDEFGLGLPPKMFGKKIGETLFSLNWLPIGGFCKLYGEDGDQKGNRAFNNKKPWQKLLIVIGGLLMNMVLSVVIFSVVYGITGIPQETNRVSIIGIAKNSPAQTVGLHENEVIVSVEGVLVHTPSEVTAEVGKYKGKNVKLQISNVKLNTKKEVTIQVREKPPAGEGSMGVEISNTEMVKVPWWQFYKGVAAGFKEAYFWGKVIVGGVFSMLSTLASGKIPKDVAGPIGMFQATTSIRQAGGIMAVFHFFAVVSVNLAVVNILPFPALDGGRIIFVIYEFIFRKRANERFEAMVNNLGMMVLLLMIGLITAGDLLRIIKK